MKELTIASACDALSQGGVIAYPTEAVWGLGCDPDNETAVSRLLRIKNRPVEKGLILVAASQQQISPLLSSLTPEQLNALEGTWPGPVTWLIPDPNAMFSSWVRGNHVSIAVRVSAHPLVHELTAAYGKPIVSTSANPAGQPEIRDRSELDRTFTGIIDGVVPGELGDSAAVSEIRDLVSGAVLR